jgi:phage gpG-like protein
MANETSDDALNLELVVSAAPIPAIKKAFRPYLEIPQELFGGKVLQKYLVQRTRNRFKRKGAHPVAQTAPSGKPWKRLAPSTIARGRDTERKLFETGALSRSIVVIKDNLKNALYTNTGGGFRIGVKSDSKAGEYARIQNYGSRSEGWSGRGYKTWIPARRFLGIGQPDKDAVNLWIKRTMKRLKL